MIEIPTNEPAELRIGDTWKWNRDNLGDYPAPAWTLTYFFKNASANFTFAATANGAAFSIVRTAAQTAPLAAGVYSWAAFVSSGAERYQVDQGDVTLLPDLGVAGNLDTRTHERRVLEAIRAVLENRATLDQEEYTIGNRSLKRTPLAELVALEQHYATRVAAQDAQDNLASGRGRSRKLQVKF